MKTPALSQTIHKLCRLWPALLAALALTLLASATPALAVNLPDGRVYEEVTPVHMNGARALPYVVAGTGEKVLYEATGAFAGGSGGQANASFAAVRTADGWQDYEDLPPASEYHPGSASFDWSDVSSDLSKDLLWLSSLSFETKLYAGVEPSASLYLQETGISRDGTTLFNDLNTVPQSGVYAGESIVTLQGGGFGSLYVGGSRDLSHLIFEEGGGGGGLEHSLIEDDLSDPGSPQYRFVDVVGQNNPDGSGTHIADCGSRLGSVLKRGEGHTGFHAISEDGSVVFFTAVGCPFFSGKEGPSVNEILARVNGDETIPISEPSLEACPGFLSGKANFKCLPAQFEGASVDGTKVFFTSNQSEEIPGVTDGTGNIYEAEIGGVSTKSVTKTIQVSAGDSSGEGARVRGVVRISDDGSHVYFVAQGKLTSSPGPEGDVAQSGADNLYVYDENGVKYIGELCSGLNASGAVADAHCPAADNNLWEGKDEHPAWAAPFGSAISNGRFLVFDTPAQLITQGPEADTDTAPDVYEYDSQTNKLVRVSTGRDGFDDNGNNNNFPATISNADYAYAGAEAVAQDNSTQFFGSRPVSNDGSYVFFMTSEALTPEDVNNAPDVYEWHNGLVSLISDGQNPGQAISLVIGTANTFIGASADGRDVFFTTPDTLIAEGGDSPAAIYDARIDGGFPQAIVPPPCREDACQGTISPTPSFPSPSSSLYSTEVALPTTATVPKPKVKSKPKKVLKRKKKPKRHKAKVGKHSKKARK